MFKHLEKISCSRSILLIAFKGWSDAAEARERKKARHEKQQIEEGIRYMASLAEDGSDPLWSENESIDANWDEEPRIQEYPFEFDVTTPSIPHYDDDMD